MRQLIFGVLIVLITLIFSIQNSNPVNIRFFFWDTGYFSLALVLFITFLTGLLSGILFMKAFMSKRNLGNKAEKKSILTN